jgi:hypothetical protein
MPLIPLLVSEQGSNAGIIQHHRLFPSQLAYGNMKPDRNKSKQKQEGEGEGGKRVTMKPDRNKSNLDVPFIFQF